MDSPYEVLGVDSDADDRTVVEAYRERVKETHPDHGGSARQFKQVQTAYERIQSGRTADATPPAASGADGDADVAPAAARVEYLDYEVLADFGWALDDDDLFEKAAAADLDAPDYGVLEVEPHESLLEAAERCHLAWPYACRGGACANCAVSMQTGDLSQPVDHILPGEMLDRDIRLSCNGMPLTDDLQVVYNVKHLPDLDDLRLPPHPYRLAYPDD